MADPLSISLRTWPSPDPTADSLPYLIARINEQKGSFRNITEASLEEEIRSIEAGESQSTHAPDPQHEGEEKEDGKDKVDELATAREEIIKQTV